MALDRETRDLQGSDDLTVTALRPGSTCSNSYTAVVTADGRTFVNGEEVNVAPGLVVPLPTAPRPSAEPRWYSAVIKWYDRERAYGFLIDDATGDEIFLHKRVVLRSDMKPIDLGENQRVEYTSQPPSRGGLRDEATAIRRIRRRV